MEPSRLGPQGWEDLTAFGQLLSRPALPPQCYTPFCWDVVIPAERLKMPRVIRVACDVVEEPEMRGQLELVVWEQVRNAKGREVLRVLCGDGLLASDIELAVQLFDDVLHAAIRRTIGEVQALEF